MKYGYDFILYGKSNFPWTIYADISSTNVICQVFHSEVYRSSGISTSTFRFFLWIFIFMFWLNVDNLIYMNIYYLLRQFLIFFILQNIFVFDSTFYKTFVVLLSVSEIILPVNSLQHLKFWWKLDLKKY